MLDIYIARHGQTRWNTEGRLQGWLDSELTAQGILSAEKLGDAIGDLSFDAYYSSPSMRAYRTLEIAAEKHKPQIIEDERLMEMGLGIWQGKLMSEIEREHQTDFTNYFHHPEKFSMPGAENYYDVKHRVQDFLQDVTHRHYCASVPKKILVITHGVTLMMMRLLFHKGEIEDLSNYGVASNAKLHIYRYDGSDFVGLEDELGDLSAR